MAIERKPLRDVIGEVAFMELVEETKRDDRALCVQCMKQEGLWSELCVAHGLLYDTGTCMRCEKAQDILFLPLGKVFVYHPEICANDIWLYSTRRRSEILREARRYQREAA